VAGVNLFKHGPTRTRKGALDGRARDSDDAARRPRGGGRGKSSICGPDRGAPKNGKLYDSMAKKISGEFASPAWTVTRARIKDFQGRRQAFLRFFFFFFFFSSIGIFTFSPRAGDEA